MIKKPKITKIRGVGLVLRFVGVWLCGGGVRVLECEVDGL